VVEIGGCAARRCAELEIVGLNSYVILVEEFEGEGPLGWRRRRKEGNIKVDVKEIGFEDVEWINLAGDSVLLWSAVNTVVNLQVPYKVRDLLCISVAVSCSKVFCPGSSFITQFRAFNADMGFVDTLCLFSAASDLANNVATYQIAWPQTFSHIYIKIFVT
jgi:hypothetical protein